MQKFKKGDLVKFTTRLGKFKGVIIKIYTTVMGGDKAKPRKVAQIGVHGKQYFSLTGRNYTTISLDKLS